MVGNGFTTTLKFTPGLEVQEFPFATVSVPLYVPAAVPAGIAILIGLAFKVALVTAAKVFVGEAFQTMLYVVGVCVVAV